MLFNKRCLGCGKPRKEWSAKRSYTPNSKYCTNACRLANAGSKRIPLDRELYSRIMGRDRHTCQYCGNAAEEIDHVIPYSRGGPSREDNLVASCWRCNHKARDLVFESFIAKQRWLSDTLGFEVNYPFSSTIKRKEWEPVVYSGVKRKRHP
jgi:hypothetical protein